MTFAQRMAAATAHECAVAERLAGAGYEVCPFGQSQIPDGVRDVLRTSDCEIRWLPDLLAVRAGRVLWIDAKGGTSQTANYSIEVAALRCHRKLAVAGYPVVIVWGDFRWNYAGDLIPDDLIAGTYSGNGSGTPFALVKKLMARPWSELVNR